MNRKACILTDMYVDDSRMMNLWTEWLFYMYTCIGTSYHVFMPKQLNVTCLYIWTSYWVLIYH